MSPADKNQLGLTDEAREIADEVKDEAGFNDRQDAYRLAIAAALAKSLPPAADGASRTTYINVGSLDPDNSIRSSILELRDDHGGRPYALAERLAEAGLADLHQHVKAGKSIRDYLAALGVEAKSESAK